MGYKKGYKFFLTNTSRIVYTVSENGSAVDGYFDIVKWLRLLFNKQSSSVRIRLSAPFLTVSVFLRFFMVLLWKWLTHRVFIPKIHGSIPCSITKRIAWSTMAERFGCLFRSTLAEKTDYLCFAEAAAY